MRRDLGAAVPRELRAPLGGILWLIVVSVGGLLSACASLCLLLVGLEAVL